MEDFLLLDQLLSQEEILMRDSVARWVDERVKGLLKEAYEHGEFPMTLVDQMAQMGLFGMTLPEEFGGAQANYVQYGLVCQELEKADSGLRSFVSVQSSLCMFPIYQFGSQAQKQKYLPKMAKGEWIGCFGLTEPDVGSDPGSMKTHAQQVSGGWVLNGAKMWITNATIADVAIIWAKTSEGQVRGFIVEKEFEGFKTIEMKHKLSLRMSITGEIVLENCFVPDDHLLPGTEKGLASALACLTQARYGIAWGAMGAGMACFEEALNYTKERTQFKRPLASFQLVQKDLVDMFCEIVKAQTFNLRLGRLKDEGKSHFAMVSMGKLNGCRQALEIARKARNLLGANGISLEYSVMRHMNNLEAVYTYEGTDNMHHLILGRYLTDLDAFSH